MNWIKRLLGKEKVTAQPRVTRTLEPSDHERALAQIDDYAQRDIAGGFRPENEIVQTVTEILCDDFDEGFIKPLVVERTRRLMDKHLQTEATWPQVTDCDRLDLAFAELEERGVVCRQDFSCCGTCGAGEIRTEMEEVRKKGTLVRGYAFYHMQDTEAAVEGRGIYLAYGADEAGELAAMRIGHEICDAMKAQGLAVDWNGDLRKRIRISLDWKRRRGPRCARA